MAQWGRNDQSVTANSSTTVESSNGAPIGTHALVKSGGEVASVRVDGANAHFGNTSAGTRASVDSTMFNNTTIGAFIPNMAVGVYGVDPADLQGLWKLDPTEAEKQELFALVIPKSAGLTQNYQIWLDLTKLPIKTQNKLTKADIKNMQSQYNEKACSTIITGYYNLQ